MRKLLEQHRLKGNQFPLIGGHRGCTCRWQENSIYAMADGIRQGADYLEIDVQLTKDRIPVIFHDIDTYAHTGLCGLVQDHTLEELQERYEVPTLLEVMTWGKEYNVNFALEIKSHTYQTQKQNLELMEYLNKTVLETGMLDQVEAFGIDYQVLRRLKTINPSFDIGLIVPFIPVDPIQLMREMDAMVYLSYAFNLTPQAVQSLQQAGYYVSGAILKDPALIDYATDIHVDMFEHDYPGSVKKD